MTAGPACPGDSKGTLRYGGVTSHTAMIDMDDLEPMGSWLIASRPSLTRVGNSRVASVDVIAMQCDQLGTLREMRIEAGRTSAKPSLEWLSSSCPHSSAQQARRWTNRDSGASCMQHTLVV